MTRPHNPPLLLVVDDDIAIRRGLNAALSQAGYGVLEAADGQEALEVFERTSPDLVLTDLAMPRMDGFELITILRRAGHHPIIVLSVRGAEGDKVRALDLGADDFVVKPFSVQEVLARVRTQLRRLGATSETAPEVLQFPELTIDRGRRLVDQGSRDVKLSPTEYGILELLALNAGKPISIAKIIAHVWKGAAGTSPDTVRVHVSSLRRKLEPDAARPRYIVTEPWVGYRFLPEPAPPAS